MQGEKEEFRRVITWRLQRGGPSEARVAEEMLKSNI